MPLVRLGIFSFWPARMLSEVRLLAFLMALMEAVTFFLP